MARLLVLGGQCWSLFDPAVQTALGSIYINLCFGNPKIRAIWVFASPRCAFAAHNIQLIVIAVALSDLKLNCLTQREHLLLLQNHGLYRI